MQTGPYRGELPGQSGSERRCLREDPTTFFPGIEFSLVVQSPELADPWTPWNLAQAGVASGNRLVGAVAPGTRGETPAHTRSREDTLAHAAVLGKCGHRNRPESVGILSPERGRSSRPWVPCSMRVAQPTAFDEARTPSSNTTPPYVRCASPDGVRMTENALSLVPMLRGALEVMRVLLLYWLVELASKDLPRANIP